MILLNIICLIIFLLVIMCFYSYFYKFYTLYILNKGFNSYDNLNQNFKPTNYTKLNNSKTHTLINEIFIKNNSLKYLKNLNTNRNWLIYLSKTIDKKINNLNQKFRTDKNGIYIENILKYLVKTNVDKLNCNIFSNYRDLYNKLHIKQKENKVAKLLIGKYLLEILYMKNRELDIILKTISKSKNANNITFYKNNTLFYAQIYSICKFNKNSTKILHNKNFNIKYVINRFFSNLNKLNYSIDYILNYLDIMFK